MSDLSSFRYRARDTSGKRQVGVIEASDVEDAKRRLRASGLLPLDAVAQSSDPKRRKAASGKPMGAGQKTEFITRLATLVGGSIALDPALRIMADGRDGPVAHAAGQMRTHIREGGTLLTGLVAQGIEDPATLALVRGAEVSGDLPGALSAAGALLTQRLALQRKVLTGLIYPALLLVVAIIAIGVIMVAIIPQFRPLVEDRMDLIPPLGRLIFAVSAVITGLWQILLFGLVAAAAAAARLWQTGRIKTFARGMGQRLPLVRDVIAKGQVTITLQVMGALLSRDVLLSDAIRVVTEGQPESPVRAALSDACNQLERGRSLSDALAPDPALTPPVLEMIRIGEQAGDLAGMTTRAATEMRESADRALERFLALFQPALIVGVGLIVGVSLYALFTAITAVNSVAF